MYGMQSVLRNCQSLS